jgi:hypothetical protein
LSTCGSVLTPTTSATCTAKGDIGIALSGPL